MVTRQIAFQGRKFRAYSRKPACLKGGKATRYVARFAVAGNHVAQEAVPLPDRYAIMKLFQVRCIVAPEVDGRTATDVEKVGRCAGCGAARRRCETMMHLGKRRNRRSHPGPRKPQGYIRVVQEVLVGFVKTSECYHRLASKAHVCADQFECAAAIQRRNEGRVGLRGLWVGFRFDIDGGDAGLKANSVAPAHITNHRIRFGFVEGANKVIKPCGFGYGVVIYEGANLARRVSDADVTGRRYVGIVEGHGFHVGRRTGRKAGSIRDHDDFKRWIVQLAQSRQTPGQPDLSLMAHHDDANVHGGQCALIRR